MPGVTTPPVVVRPFGADQVAPYITLPIPAAAPGTPGLASFATGFPALNMTNPAAGGVPPIGADMNGILYTATAWCAMLQAGQMAHYDPDVATAIDGYALGAFLAADDGLGFWFNITDGNVSDPDAGGLGWVGFRPSGTGYLSTIPPAGTTDNYAPAGFGPGVGVIDLNPNLGNATLTGLAGGTNGQRVVLSNVHASNSVVLRALDGGSLAANQFRLPANMTLLQNMAITFQYSSGAGLWLNAL